MRVMLLSWSVTGHGGPTHQATGLARRLADRGVAVHLLTRRPEGGGTLDVPGVAVHAAHDAPPVVPGELGQLPQVLSFATRALAAATRWLAREPVDLVHVDGWVTAPTALALTAEHGLPTLTVTGGPDHPARGELLAALAATGPILERGGTLPWGLDLPARAPTAPPTAGPVLLVPPPAGSQRAVAAALRRELRTARRITAGWARRPAVVVVLDPEDTGTVLTAGAAGVPVVTVPGGTAAEVVTAGGGGVVVAQPEVATEVDQLLGDGEQRARLGAAGYAHLAAAHGWPAATAAWHRAASGALAGHHDTLREVTGRPA